MTVCFVPLCAEPYVTDGMCAKHRAVEAAAVRLVDWWHRLDHEEYDPRVRWRREAQEKAERAAVQARTIERLARMDFSGDGTAYGVAALAGILRDLAGTDPGSRNVRLNSAAYRVGRLVAGGMLRSDVAVHALRRAGEAMELPELEAKSVVRRAFHKGMEHPYETRRAA